MSNSGTPEARHPWYRKPLIIVGCAAGVLALAWMQGDEIGRSDDSAPAACAIQAWDTNIRQFPMPDELPFDTIMHHYPRISFACETYIETGFQERFQEAEPGDPVTLPLSVEENGVTFYDQTYASGS